MNSLSKSKIFLYCLIFFILGVGIASAFSSDIIKFKIYFFTASVMALVFLILWWKNFKIRIILFFLFFLFLGLWRLSLSLPINSPDKIWFYNGQKLEIIGQVCNEPDVRAANQKLEICAEKQSGKPVVGKILVTVDLYPAFNYGDRLKINCELQTPEKINDFSYDRYLARYDIYSVCYYPKIIQEAEDLAWADKIYRKIFAIKQKIAGKINTGIPEPEASLANAFLLNYGKGMPNDLKLIFSHTGTSHFIAISGMHITVLSGMLMILLINFGMKRKQAFYFSTLLIIVYVLIIGLPASAMRAGLMGFLVLLALNLGRLNKMVNSIILTAAILIFINPKILRDDIGFQLSFLAVLGIGFFYPWLNNKFESWLEKTSLSYYQAMPIKAITNALLLTLSAQILTLPIVIYNFKIISVVSFLTNLLIVWVSDFLLVGLMVAVFLSFIFPYFTLLFFWPLTLLIKYIIFVCRFTEKIPGAYWLLDYVWAGWIVFFYLFFFAVWLYSDFRRLAKQKTAPVVTGTVLKKKTI